MRSIAASSIPIRDRPAPAAVIDLASRRNRCPANEPQGPPAEDEGLESAASYWEGALGAAGLDFETPVPASVVLPLVTAELERLVGGLMVVREGGGPRNLPPDPDAGMDALSAMECAGLLRDLSAVAQRGLTRAQQPE